MTLKLFFILTFILSTFSPAWGETQSFSNLGHQAIDKTWTEIQSLGLVEMDPWSSELPRPQVPALRAIVSQRTGLIAYFDEENGYGATTLVFKNPNGGYRHSVTFSRDAISFVTPYQGTVAHANSFMTVNGPDYNFYCQSRRVTEQGFFDCIQSLFIDVIIKQLRRFTH